MSGKEINVARDFTPFPFGRYLADDPERSGEAFRERHLVPALKAGGTVEVNLDGIEGGIGSSFLEEVFGGLVRKGHFAAAELEGRLRVTCRDKRYADRAWNYIRNAKAEGH